MVTTKRPWDVYLSFQTSCNSVKTPVFSPVLLEVASHLPCAIAYACPGVSPISMLFSSDGFPQCHFVSTFVWATATVANTIRHSATNNALCISFFLSVVYG